MFSVILSIGSIIVGIVCITIACSWPQRPAKWFFCGFVALAIILPSFLGIVFHLVIMTANMGTGFPNSATTVLQAIGVAQQFLSILSMVLLVIFTLTMRSSPVADSIAVAEFANQPLVGPSWNTELDSKQKRNSSSKRNLAFAIDNLPFLLAALGYVQLILHMHQSQHKDPAGWQLTLTLLLSVVCLLAPIYMLVKDCIGGRSIGKRIMGCRAVSSKTGRPIGITESMTRNLLFIVPLFAFVELIVSFVRSDGKRVGDLMAETQIVTGPPQFIDGKAVEYQSAQEHPLDAT